MKSINNRSLDSDTALSLIINSGIYRHHTLREQMYDAFCMTDCSSSWSTLKSSHWEILYYLVECRLLNRAATLSEIPLGTGVPSSTSRRVLRRLEEFGLVTITCDEMDNRRFNTELASEYHQIVDNFLADCVDDFAGLMQLHDREKCAQETLERTRDELIKSEALFVHAQRLAELGHWVWDDINSGYLMVSEENARIHGMSASEFIGTEYLRNFDDRFIHPDDKELIIGIVREADQSGMGYDVCYRIVRPDSTIRCFREISEPVLDQHGKLVRSIGTTQDITSFVVADNTLKENSALTI